MKKIFLLFVISSLFLSCDLFGPKSVEYKITGTATTVDITYENSSGGTSQKSDVSVPWTYSFEADSGAFIYVSAQNQGSTGTVTTTIYVDGDEYKTSTSSGAYVIATVSGSVE